MPTVRFEQAVYGSFAFWDRGYALLAQSPGCRPEWIAEFLAACRHYGQPRGDSPEAPGLFSLRLKFGPWIVVGVSPQGHDDRGRPGALAFHSLFVTPREYRKAGHVPFGLSGALRGDWTAETRTLPPGTWPVEVPGTPEPPHDPRALRIAAVLARGEELREPLGAAARRLRQQGVTPVPEGETAVDGLLESDPDRRHALDLGSAPGHSGRLSCGGAKSDSKTSDVVPPFDGLTVPESSRMARGSPLRLLRT